ncbi:uncharacterized protein [Pyrus communis]|uniref:uncharacterized protein n=1 Tax=Pyrus communis TaxID=23211 RepID=UPI0035C21FF2
MECIITLLQMCCRSLTFSSSSSSTAVDPAAGDAEDVDIPPHQGKYDVFISFRGEDSRLGTLMLSRLTNLKTLRFCCCHELKEFPSGSIHLLSLKVLDLHGTRISEIPDGLVGSTSLQDLDLSRSTIRSIPASIKQASQLHRLSLIGCKRLQSLPELPVDQVIRIKQRKVMMTQKPVNKVIISLS